MRKLRSLFLLWLPLAIITLILLPASAPAEAAYSLYPSSAFLQPIPAGSNYVLEPRISTFRQGSEEYAAPVYGRVPQVVERRRRVGYRHRPFPGALLDVEEVAVHR